MGVARARLPMAGCDEISGSVAGLGRKADAAIAIGNLLGEVVEFSVAVPRGDLVSFDKDAIEQVGRGEDSGDLARSEVADAANCEERDAQVVVEVIGAEEGANEEVVIGHGMGALAFGPESERGD